MNRHELGLLKRTPMPPGCYSLQIMRRYFGLVLNRDVSDDETREILDALNGDAKVPRLRLEGVS